MGGRQVAGSHAHHPPTPGSRPCGPPGTPAGAGGRASPGGGAAGAVGASAGVRGQCREGGRHAGAVVAAAPARGRAGVRASLVGCSCWQLYQRLPAMQQPSNTRSLGTPPGRQHSPAHARPSPPPPTRGVSSGAQTLLLPAIPAVTAIPAVAAPLQFMFECCAGLRDFEGSGECKQSSHSPQPAAAGCGDTAAGGSMGGGMGAPAGSGW